MDKITQTRLQSIEERLATIEDLLSGALHSPKAEIIPLTSPKQAKKTLFPFKMLCLVGMGLLCITWLFVVLFAI